MSIAVLGQVYDEARRLAIAGSAVAPGDFRLKKLIPALEQAGERSLVFAKIAQSTKTLVESNEKTSSAALLELGTLINAVLYTQGETGIDGAMQEVDSKSFGLSRTQTSARLLKPLLEALTSTGSGRMEIIRDAFERGLFRDLRLIRPSLVALDDTYGEIAEFISEHVLPIYGTAVFAELESQFDPKGKGGHVRRLKLMHRLDAAAARPHVQRSLDEGSKEMRIIAISCLGSSPEDLSFLIEQSKSKAKDVRAAAFQGLSQSQASDAVPILKAVIDGNDLNLAIGALRSSHQPGVVTALQQSTESAAQGLLTIKEKDKAKTGRAMQRLISLLQCFTGRTDPATESLLISMLDQRARWLAIKADPSGADLVEQLSTVLASGSERMQRAVARAHSDLPVDCLTEAFAAASRVLAPDEVFTMFGAYIKNRSAKKKGKDLVTQKQAVIIDAICGDDSYRFLTDNESSLQQASMNRLSAKWLEVAIEYEHDELVVALAVPGNDKSNAALAKIARGRIEVNKDILGIMRALDVMIRVRHPEAVDTFLWAIEKSSRSTPYHLAWLGQLIPQLPKDAALPKLEAILPTLPDKASSILIDYVAELKNRALPQL